MAFTPQQISAAKVVQTAAAHDKSAQIRLVAGPGTGKSYSIGERVAWLIGQGVNPDTIYAVSFTRAATDELKGGINKYCAQIPTTSHSASQINVMTLHSLALKILALGGKLSAFPTRPTILDDWEQRNIFDEELKGTYNFSIKRCEELRIHFESIWSTGNPPLPFISSPVPAISQAEQTDFINYHRGRAQLYSCLLPGEAVRQCVDNIKTGTLDPKIILNMEHLIVDEYQDLNICDVEFIDILAQKGIHVFVSGDDDQSIYSFRYAYPTGIQTFNSRHTNSGQHALQSCFRCTPSVLDAASNLLVNNSPATRIPKSLQSVYCASTPPVQGSVNCFSFADATSEAQALASSVCDLVNGGIKPKDILILLSSRRAQLAEIQTAMDSKGILLNIQQNVEFAGNGTNRFVYSMLRILHSSDDYLAYRTILGLRKGTGLTICVNIADKILNNSLNFIHQFGPSRSAGIFRTNEIRALDGVVSVVNAMAGWALTDTLGSRTNDIAAIISHHLSQQEAAVWLKWVSQLPKNMTLRDLKNILSCRSEEEARGLLYDIYTRLNEKLPPELDPNGRVRVMTLHSSKGLGAKVVFIPGLEEELLPGPYRALYPGQIQEAARLLYVGITRAKAACIVSYAQTRLMNGRRTIHHSSRFAPDLGVAFQARAFGLTNAEVKSILSHCSNL